MHLVDFAIGILRAEELEAKLYMPRIASGDGLTAIAPQLITPPRYAAIDKANDQKASFPRPEELATDLGRAKALHFFANHELQAIELMAAMLVKFPSMPEALKRSLVSTLVDEQSHCRLYLDRMRQLGCSFGDFGVSRYFWDELSTVPSIVEFVAGMSLTFEQANLDFALQYAKLFYECGDDATSKILETVYRDEIRHVKLGVAWANEWRGRMSLWEFHQHYCPGNLTPARAKGKVLDRPSRKMAGLADDYIDSLISFSRSKGRSPDLYWFNPGCTTEWLGDVSRGAADIIERDLAQLLHVASGESNQVLVPEEPSADFLNHLSAAGFDLPHFITADELNVPAAWRPQRLLPWGLSPRAARLSERHTKSPMVTLPNQRIFSKEFAASLATTLGGVVDCNDSVCSDQSDLAEKLASILECGYPKAMIKENYGAAGQGNHVVDTKIGLTSGLIEKLFQRNDALIVEPYLERVIDYSGHANVDQDGLTRYLGHTFFAASAKGQYRGCYVGKTITQEIQRQLWQLDNDRCCMPSFEQTIRATATTVGNALNSHGYSGPFSFDAFVYRDRSHRLALRSLVEVNPRWTMGRIGLILSKKIEHGAWGFFQILRTLPASPRERAETLLTEHPVELGRRNAIRSGTVLLSDAWRAKHWLACLEVRNPGAPFFPFDRSNAS